MTEREKLIEAMARAICDEWGYLWDGDPDEDSQVSPENSKGYDERPSKLLFRTAATKALAAIERFGAVVVPVKATERMDELCCDAMASGIIVGSGYMEFGATSAQEAWSAMLSASPYAKEPT